MDRLAIFILLAVTARLNEQVKRTIKRFPKHFMFQLTEQEKVKVVANCDHFQKLNYIYSQIGNFILYL
ncbi:MAG: ORF6N domain-containing protein [Bacteroidales bacterium]|nr:ORF6N domain-containing protein [Bacteroidales bacterium]